MERSLTTVLGGNIRHPTLATRAAAIAVLLFLEKVLLSRFMPPADEALPDGLLASGLAVEHWISHFLLAFVVAIALFAYVRADAPLLQLNQSVRATPFRQRWLLLHALCAIALVPLMVALMPGRGIQLPAALLLATWLLVAVGAVLAVMAAAASRAQWQAAAASLGVLWLFAAVLAVLGASAVTLSQQLWDLAARVTFDLVKVVLSPFVPSLMAYPDTQILSTNRFAVEVTRRCSGLEGVGMMLALCSAWLLLFRKEYIFPRALLLIPAGLLLIFALNVLRIAVLVLIGHAGYPEVAVYGFHSQAGWIAFNFAGCATLFVSRRSSWLTHTAAQSARTETNPTAPYLLPLIAILSAGMLAHAMSRGFETLYVLRLIAGAAVLIYFRRQLKGLDWRFTWRGIGTGILVLMIWLFVAHSLVPPSAMPQALVAMPPTERALWITTRATAAILTVPIAEELAYRGWLMRRLQAPDFEAVRFRQVGWFAVTISALMFGLAHGSMWVAGIVAGGVYGMVARRTGRFGEAVAAHATTNAGLSALVLCWNQWSLW